MTSRTGRPRWWVAGLSLLLVAAAVAAGLVLLRDDTYRVPIGAGGPSAADGPTPAPALAASALHALEHAIDSGDATALVATAPDPEAGALLEAVVANGRDLRVEEFTARYVDEVGAVDADGSWQAAVAMTWAFAGFDPEPASAEVLVRFAPAGTASAGTAAVGITSFEAAPAPGEERRSPVWLGGRVHTARERGVLVLARQSRAVARQYAGRLRAAYPAVRAVLPRWRPRVVLEVPESAVGLDAALGVPAGTYGAVAAVTTTVDGSTDPGAPVHVFVNPEVSGRLRGQGAQIVVTHEVTHVATGAAVSPLPLWLLEGFADYVALRDVRLPLSVTAARIAGEVRREGAPRRLPGPDEFEPTADGLEAVYEAAWVACLVLAEEVGEDGLLRVYRSADAGTDVGAALRAEGIPEQRLVRLWRQRLQDLAT